MRNLFFIVFFFGSSISAINSQVEFGIKGGIHSIELGRNPIGAFQDPDNDGKITFLESSYGIHGGMFIRIKFLGLFVEPNILFNSTSVDYRLTDSNEGGDFSEIHKETFKNVDIPLLVGTKFLIFDIFGGPVAHLKIDRASDIIDFDGYGERIDRATYGFQMGLGLSLGKVKAQVSYEGNLSAFGEAIKIGDSTFMVDEKSARMIFSLGYKF